MPTSSSLEANSLARRTWRVTIPAVVAALTTAALTVTAAPWGVDQAGAKDAQNPPPPAAAQTAKPA